MKDALKIIENFRKGKASPKEMELLDRWIHEMDDNSPLMLSEEEHNEIKIKGRKIMQSFISTEKRSSPWLKLSIAASITLAVLAGGYYYLNNKKLTGEQIAQTDINPGKVAATLTLSNGKKIYIADVGNGKIAEEAGVKISKNEKGEIVYTLIVNQSEIAKTQTLTTYRGETQAVVLPDGSKVWLNAASSLKYPSSFAAASRRRVELAGEAYFEIAKDKAHPFIVATSKQDVEVLGTHFNVNSYNDEQATKTTLLEGSVKITDLKNSNSRILKPGEQSKLDATGIKIAEVDEDDAIAWKEGYIIFEGEDLENIMKKVSRWYNVDVEFKDNESKSNRYYGSVSRQVKLSEVLKRLEKLQPVKLTLKNHKIIAEKKSK